MQAASCCFMPGRDSDVTWSGIETVHASEVEQCRPRHPDVPAAAVVGSLHARLGEQVVISSRVLSHVSSHELYGRDVGAPEASATLISVHIGHGACASVQPACRVLGLRCSGRASSRHSAGSKPFQVMVPKFSAAARW